MIYYILFPQDYTEESYAGLYARLRPLLADFRRKKADSILHPRERAASALAYLLLCHGIESEYNGEICNGGYLREKYCPSGIRLPEFTYDDKKKPELAPPYANIFFNLSHCKTGVACAVSDRPIGVDIQDIRQVKDSVIKRFIGGCEASPDKIHRLASSPCTFTAFWSRYEAYVKLTGDGIRLRPANCDNLSEEFLRRKNVSIMTKPLSYECNISQTAYAYLSAASYNCAVKSSFSTIKLDFSDFCRSLFP